MSKSWFSKSDDRTEPTLTGEPPVENLPCRPTLIMGLMNWHIESLRHVFINDIVFSSNATFSIPYFGDRSSVVVLHILNYLDGKSLVTIAKEFGGPIIMTDKELFEMYEKDENTFTYECKDVQAIITNDSFFFHYIPFSSFVKSKYYNDNVSVVVLSCEGIYDLKPLRDNFGVNWSTVAYTKLDICLNEAGKKIIGLNGFPREYVYTKALFVCGECEMFTEFVHPVGSEDDSDSDYEYTKREGSPVVVKIDGKRSVSYFGFVNNMDISFGAIILRLCYASSYDKLESNAA